MLRNASALSFQQKCLGSAHQNVAVSVICTGNTACAGILRKTRFKLGLGRVN
jgi:hypothetical protein